MDMQRKIPRIARPGLLIALCSVLFLLLVAAVTFNFVQQQELSKQRANSKRLNTPIARVEMRTVSDGVTVPGSFVSPQQQPLKLGDSGVLGQKGGETKSIAGEQAGAESESEKNESQTSGPARNVITKAVRTPGEELWAGTLIAEVSGRPVFAALPNTPLYRDMRVGDSGTDVQMVQQLLNSMGYSINTDGYFGGWTLGVIKRWYADSGYKLPGDFLPWQELLPLPANPLKIVSVAPVGTVQQGENSLLAYAQGDTTIVSKTDGATAAAFQVGQAAWVRVAGRNMQSTVLSITEPSSKDGENLYTLIFALPAELDPTASQGASEQNITVSNKDIGEAVLAVPLAAVQEDSAGTWVRVVPDKWEKHPALKARKVPVKITNVAGGWAAIKDNKKLPAGTKIFVE